MLIMDKIAYSSKILKLSPAFKAGLALFTLLCTIIAGENIFSAAVFVFMSFMCIVISGFSVKKYVKLCFIPFWFLLLGAATISVSFLPQPTGVFNLPFFGGFAVVTQAGLLQAANMFLKAMACVSCLYFLYVTTPISELLGLLDKLHTPKLMTELMMMTYRFIFILINMAQQMKIAQNSRLGNINYKSSFRSLSVLASSLFVGAFVKSEQIYSAMESRGYSGDFAFTGELTPVTKGQKLILSLYITLLLALLVLLKL